jgi:hypothetical protein
MTPFCSSFMQSLGLVADIAGASLLFLYGVPPLNRTAGANYLELAGKNEASLDKETKFDRRGRLGISLLVVGFVLQLVPNAIVAFSEWVG